MKLEYLKKTPRLFFKNGALPLYFIHFVTTKCNLQCSHCFYHNSLCSNDSELTIDEIKRITKSIGEILLIILTGGEPFLRSDLPEIARLYYENAHAREIAIITNGTLLNKISEIAPEIAKNCPQAKIMINLSIDGVGKVHDDIRTKDGTFENVIESYKLLKEIQKEHSNIEIKFLTTLSSLNQDHIDELTDYISKIIDKNTWDILLVRGEPKEPCANDVDIEKYNKLCRQVEKLNKKKHQSFFDKFQKIKNKYQHNLISKTISTNKFQIPCYAGLLSGVMYPKGEIFACELLDRKIGNIQNYKYNFKQLWHSKEASTIRKYIRSSKCYCTHECFMATNILFNITTLYSIIKNTLNKT